MTTTAEFKQEQRSVLWAMMAALVVTAIVLGAALTMERTEASWPFADRLQFALRADLFVGVWLLAAIANVARLRFLSERDIAGSSAAGGSDEVRAANAVLQNTLEQVALAIVTHLIVVATFSRSNALLVALVFLFAVGRLLFWIGYRHGAKGRAFGFALTFYPSVLGLLASAMAILFDGSL